jgi:N-acetylglucosaminyl-diphospho-decaprenol L-rhamnosyltransferase
MAADASGATTSIIIVVADSGPVVRESVAAALASTASVEVIVIDNASSDGERERLQGVHADDARLRVLVNEANIGFGPACNRGAAIARGDTLLFLNPDCRVDAGLVAALQAHVKADPTIGLLGIDIVSPDGAHARGNRRRDPTLRRAFMSYSGLARLEGRWPSLAGVEMAPRTAASDGIESVDAVSGACMFVPRHVFAAIDGFDEHYFLHVEDLDLCRRVRDAGYVVAIAPSLHAVHAQGSSSRHRRVFVAWHKHRGMWRYFRRFDPAATNPLLRGIVWLGLWAHFALTVPVQLVRQHRAKRAAASVDVD